MGISLNEKYLLMQSTVLFALERMHLATAAAGFFPLHNSPCVFVA